MDMVQLVIWFRSTPTLELIVFNKRKDPAEAPRRIERRMERLNLPLCTACNSSKTAVATRTPYISVHPLQALRIRLERAQARTGADRHLARDQIRKHLVAVARLTRRRSRGSTRFSDRSLPPMRYPAWARQWAPDPSRGAVPPGWLK